MRPKRYEAWGMAGDTRHTHTLTPLEAARDALRRPNDGAAVSHRDEAVCCPECDQPLPDHLPACTIGRQVKLAKEAQP